MRFNQADEFTRRELMIKMAGTALGVSLAPMFGASVVILMVWLPDGLLSIPDKLRARAAAREASAARKAAAGRIGVSS